MPPSSFDVDAYCDKLSKSNSEHGHQRAFFGWLNWAVQTGLHPMARMCYAIPNGGKRDQITAARLKAEGVKPGVPDVHYPVALGGFHSLYIELKAANGSASDAQNEMHIDLRVCGHAVSVCWGWRAAAKCFSDYASGAILCNEYK